MDPLFRFVLYQPEIPGNTGSLGRTSVALQGELILIKPLGFDISEKAVRRAGLDYWKHVRLKVYESWDDFIEKESPEKENLFFFENEQGHKWFEGKYTRGCYLVFGSETKGIPLEILNQYKERTFHFPQYDPHIRSLNLSNIGTCAAYECVRQLLSQ